MIGRIGEWVYQLLWLCWKMLLSILTFNRADTRILAFLIVIHCTHSGQVVETQDDEEEHNDNT